MGFSSSNPSHHTDTFFDFLVKLLYFPSAFPQELVPSNISVLCTQQPDVRSGIKHEILGMLGGNADQVSSTAPSFPLDFELTSELEANLGSFLLLLSRTTSRRCVDRSSPRS